MHYTYTTRNENKLPVDAVAVEDCSGTDVPLWVVELVPEAVQHTNIHKSIST